MPEKTPAYYPAATEKKPRTSYAIAKGAGIFPDFIRFHALIVSKFQVLVRWEVHPDHKALFSPDDYSYTLYRNDLSDLDTAEPVSPPIQGAEELLDSPPSVQSKWRQIYYWVEVSNVSGESLFIGPARVNEAASLSQMGRAMVQRLLLLMRNFPVGTPVFVYPQRQWGTRCGVCWNTVRMRSTDSNCPSCMGTGWINPYPEIPFSTYFAFSSSLEGIQWGDEEIEPDDRNAWTINVPALKKRDLVYVPALQQLYRVKAVQWMAQEAGLTGVQQGCLLTPVLVSSPEFEVFSGTHNLDDVRAAIQLIANVSEKTYFGGRSGLPPLTPGLYEHEKELDQS